MLTVLCGPARCGKTERLLVRYRAALAEQPPGSTLWIAPTWRAAAEVRGRLFDGQFAGCLAPGITTFEKFAESVLAAAGIPIRPVTRLMKRELVRQIVGEQASRGRLGFFQSIAATGGLVDLVCELIGELKRLEIWPEHFHRACIDRGETDKDRELFEIYDLYQQTLRESGLFDAEGRFWSARDVLMRGEGRGERGEGRAEGGGRRAEGAKSSESPFPFSSSALRPPSSALFSFIVLDGFTDFTRTQHEIIEILARDAAATIVSLPLEPQPSRADLFAKPLGTLAELRRRHGDLAVEELVRTASDWPAIDHLERTLFVNPRGQESGTNLQISKSPNPKSSNPQSLIPNPSVSGIEILAAASQLGEIELIAGRIKRLLVDGDARPGEIAVVFRQPQDLGGLVGEVFSRLGVPVAFESGEALDRSPALRALVALLTLELDDWPFGQLLSVLGSNYFQPAWPEWRQVRAAADVEQTIRRLQIPRGRQRLLEQLARGTGDGARGTRDGGRGLGTSVPSEVLSAQCSVLSDQQISKSQIPSAILQRLAAAFDALPARATLPDWAKSWQRLAEDTGLLRAMDEQKAEGGGRRGEDASEAGYVANLASSALRPPPSPLLSWDRLMETLAAGDTLAGWLGRRPPELDRRAAVEALLDILHNQRVGHAGDESGCVRVLSAASARALRIPHLFLAGLSERAFPPPQRDDRLYSETEYSRLIDAGLPLTARTERTRAEMLLFYESVTRADRRLCLSYPALDESAQPLLPSPFLREVEQAFAPTPIPRTGRTDLSPIPSDDEPLGAAEFRVKALATALEGNVALLAGLMGGEGGGRRAEGGKCASVHHSSSSIQHPSNPQSLIPSSFPLLSPLSSLPSLSENLAAGLELIYLRQDRERFGPAEGVLAGRVARDYLAARFPPRHTFSATELERYASCPFRFFLERILRIEPLEDLALEFDVMQRGRVVHDVLAAFHRRVNERLGRPASPLELDAAEFDAMLSTAIAESLPPEPQNPLAAALAEIDRRLVVQWLAQYRGQFEKYGALWKGFETTMAPELFEVSFGRDDEPPPSTDRPLEFTFEGQTVRVSGRIDRIDIGVVAGEMVCNVLDYKTGGGILLGPETIKAGLTLQLPLYVFAAMELLLADRDLIPWQAGYWYVREGGYKPRQALRMYRNDDGRIELEPQWEEIRSGLAETVVGLARGVRRGQFPVCSADRHCTGRCPYNTVCRINQVRSLEKTCQPTATE